MVLIFDFCAHFGAGYLPAFGGPVRLWRKARYSGNKWSSAISIEVDKHWALVFSVRCSINLRHKLKN